MRLARIASSARRKRSVRTGAAHADVSPGAEGPAVDEHRVVAGELTGHGEAGEGRTDDHAPSLHGSGHGRES